MTEQRIQCELAPLPGGGWIAKVAVSPTPSRQEGFDAILNTAIPFSFIPADKLGDLPAEEIGGEEVEWIGGWRVRYRTFEVPLYLFDEIDCVCKHTIVRVGDVGDRLHDDLPELRPMLGLNVLEPVGEFRLEAPRGGIAVAVLRILGNEAAGQL